MSDENLRAAYQENLKRSSVRAGVCVEPDALHAIVEGTASESERLATLRHVGGCPRCRAELDLLRSASDAAAGATARPWWQQRPVLAAAAVTIVTLGVLGIWSANREPGVDQVRTGTANGVQLTAPLDDATATLPVTLVWGAVPNARRYDIEVLQPTGEVAFATTSQDTTVTIPSSALRAGDYRWWVTGVGLDGTVRSSTRRLRITP